MFFIKLPVVIISQIVLFFISTVSIVVIILGIYVEW